jgi:hypothetical protein
MRTQIANLVCDFAFGLLLLLLLKLVVFAGNVVAGPAQPDQTRQRVGTLKIQPIL